MHILFATAEYRPLVSAGGLGEAAAGMVAGLRSQGVEVTVALPDYSRWPLDDEVVTPLDVPGWVAPASVRTGTHAEAGAVALIDVPGIERPDPYVDAQGEGWWDNDRRFVGFSAAVAALAHLEQVDVVQLNDWHTSYVPAFLDPAMPSVMTIHNLAHQGWGHIGWLDALPHFAEAYVRGDAMNGLAGALRVVDRIVAVSPTYAHEITTTENGMGLDDILVQRRDHLTGIRNGIDTRSWDPATDTHVPRFDATDLAGKAQAREDLLERFGWSDNGDPIFVMVTRLVDQKGVDLAFDAARFLDGMRARLVVLGSGSPTLTEWGRGLAAAHPERFAIETGYDVPLSHLLFAGGDLLLMPSRFEPCGLAQMQAMAYGTIPVVTPVGGLCDTVVDDDAHPKGNGFIAATVDPSGVVDAMHRGLRAVRHSRRRGAVQRRGMTADWSWTEPAAAFISLYKTLLT